MDSQADLDGMLETYRESLETQIYVKRDLLKQVRKAIDELPAVVESEGSWRELLSKPLFRPDRSDPIGLSLASVSQTTRLETTKTWIEEKERHLSSLESMLRDQRDANKELIVLTDLLEHKLEGMSSKDQKENSKKPAVLNDELLRNLEDFTKNVLAVDLVDAEEAGNDLSEEVFSLILRLLNHDDTLEVIDFHNCSKKLYRLLLRSNLITVIDSPNDRRYVRLLDFASYDLS